ncbi:cytochrome cbb3 oxidase biogenesis protein CcoH [Psychroflexus torquis ATCC 700755]|uniref:Cytochrome cbb3 oxidase biogenesis protein CcoH n=1 Tax=Psychroflexus torquis (strain ATCC 700755 / CIP 106069 / ACAM 623) TaxID=313595 RepID=K4IK81_PSYTT|nr:FixH family protein [Psychroflexus torquis]AFU69486.1 cytochrome cbb3 oxidase biogenesis protein CcoH [Psychroflexus torquis ATCC 700755]
MKINWGTGLVIGMVIFIGFILILVYKMTTDHNLEHDLVTDGYYQKEMELQDDIYARQNSMAMEEQIIGQKNTKGYVLEFPESYDPKNIEGMVFLYRTSSKKLDFELPLDLTDSNFLIPDEFLLKGRWNITIDWEYEGKKFRFKKEITY